MPTGSWPRLPGQRSSQHGGRGRTPGGADEQVDDDVVVDVHPWYASPLLGARSAATGMLTRRPGHLRRRIVVAESVAELSHKALTAEQPDALLRESLQMAIEVIGADYGTAVRRLSHGQLRVAHELGPEPLPPGTLLPLAPERSYVLRVIETGRPFSSHDLRCDPRISPPGPLLDRGIVSGLAVPVRGGDSVMGALALHSRHQRRFSRDDVATASALASVVATAWSRPRSGSGSSTRRCTTRSPSCRTGRCSSTGSTTCSPRDRRRARGTHTAWP